MENRNLLTMKQKIQYIIGPTLIIMIAALLRLMPHPPNMAPIAAMALFGGAYLDKKYALIFPLVALFLSDLVLGFHASMFLVYTSFFLTGLIGLWLAKHKKVSYIVSASILSSVIFYLLTNFNYWYATPLYPKTLAGLEASYTAALPFFRNTLIGDLGYTTLFFASFEVMRAILHLPKLAKREEHK